MKDIRVPVKNKNWALLTHLLENHRLNQLSVSGYKLNQIVWGIVTIDLLENQFILVQQKTSFSC
jgi:hypothetical protein